MKRFHLDDAGNLLFPEPSARDQSDGVLSMVLESKILCIVYFFNDNELIGQSQGRKKPLVVAEYTGVRRDDHLCMRHLDPLDVLRHNSERGDILQVSKEGGHISAMDNHSVTNSFKDGFVRLDKTKHFLVVFSFKADSHLQ